MNLEFGKAVEDIMDVNVVKELKQSPDSIIFGAGESGVWVVRWLRSQGIFPKCFCDNYVEKWMGEGGGAKEGLPIMSFDSAMEKYPRAAICVASMWAEDILKQIGALDERLLLRSWDLLKSMAWETSNMIYKSDESRFIKENLCEFNALYNELEDEYSKNTLEGVLNYRLTRDKSYLDNIKSNEDVYLDKTIISSTKFESIVSGTIVDGGAFDGDTVDMLIRHLGKMRILNICCFEAEEHNWNKIEEKLPTWSPHRIHIHKAALWSGTGDSIAFEGDGLSGGIKKVSSIRNDEIYTQRLDDCGYDNISLIKLDIEGAEREALKGAERIIKKCRPVLAICAYHLQDDLLCLWELIRTIGAGDYKLYLRHYMRSSGDTILYAIPTES